MNDTPSLYDPWIVVWRSPSRAECDERAFVLAAVGIGSSIKYDGGNCLLQVDDADLGAALIQLRAYEAERRQAPRPVAAPPAPVHRGAWIGSVAYVLVLTFIALAPANGWLPASAYERGALDGARVQSGEWWRAWTALTLHWDLGHLVGNLGAGVWFGYLAGRQLGVGTAWLLIVSGAAAANLFDAHFGPATYLSAGASTQVFSALGLIAAHSSRSRLHLPQRSVLRWAPLVGGVILLGWFGTAGEGTDLVAHALGFLFGGALGVLVAMPAVESFVNRIPQWLSGAAALASLGIAWHRALG